jgi:hypothetical protein
VAKNVLEVVQYILEVEAVKVTAVRQILVESKKISHVPKRLGFFLRCSADGFTSIKLMVRMRFR